jgi:hypothetical protein
MRSEPGVATIGQTFKAARAKKNVTTSQAAAAIRAKIQIVEAMEQDNFRQMAAPMYARGFIKLYAEYLGLDPTPLLREYSELHAPQERPPLVVEDTPRPKNKERGKAQAERLQAMLRAVGRFLASMAQRWKKPVAAAAGVCMVLVLVLLGLGRCSRRVVKSEEARTPAKVETRALASVVSEPPEPYLEGTGVSAQQP